VRRSLLALAALVLAACGSGEDQTSPTAERTTTTAERTTTTEDPHPRPGSETCDALLQAENVRAGADDNSALAAIDLALFSFTLETAAGAADSEGFHQLADDLTVLVRGLRQDPPTIGPIGPYRDALRSCEGRSGP
jgi:hypothetical protein